LNLLCYKADSSREAPLWGFFVFIVFVFVVSGLSPITQAWVMNEVIVRMGLVPIFVFWAATFAGLVYCGLKHGIQARIVRANDYPGYYGVGL
jgi:hypothetical protein